MGVGVNFQYPLWGRCGYAFQNEPLISIYYEF
jgi:hypothetical protein